MTCLTSASPPETWTQTLCGLPTLASISNHTSGRVIPILTPTASGTPRTCQLQSGSDKLHQVLQLLLQALLISMVLNDPVEVPKVVQATF